jgi:hypothetical protein
MKKPIRASRKPSNEIFNLLATNDKDLNKNLVVKYQLLYLCLFRLYDVQIKLTAIKADLEKQNIDMQPVFELITHIDQLNASYNYSPLEMDTIHKLQVEIDNINNRN